MTSILRAAWQATIEGCIADHVSELGRRRPELGPDQLADVTETLLRIARRVFPGASAETELTPTAAAVLHEFLRTADDGPFTTVRSRR